MSNLRRKKIGCGPFGSFTLMIGDQEKAVAYVEDKTLDDCTILKQPKGGFVAGGDDVHVWINIECDLNNIIAHEAFHAACSLLQSHGITLDFTCPDCEEMCAILTGWITSEIGEQIYKWHP